MRTTLNLDDELYRQVRLVAAQSGRTVTSLLEDALRLLLSRAAEPEHTEALHLTTVKGRGTLPGVDLDDSRALADLMDRPERPKRESRRRAAV